MSELLDLDAPKYLQAASGSSNGSLLEHVDLIRLRLAGAATAEHRAELGQFLTPAPVARFMAGLLNAQAPCVRLLDAGAGVGALSAAVVAELCTREERPRELSVTAYELDADFLGHLGETLEACRLACDAAGIVFRSEIIHANFVEAASELVGGGLFASAGTFDAAILNPPYRKIRMDSEERRWLRSVGIETTNLYTAFLWLSMRLLAPGGELVAITPRSFCNGPYFKPFRAAFLEAMWFRRFHVFHSRAEAFREDRVLQENVVFHAVKSTEARGPVTISANAGPDDEATSLRVVPPEQLVRPGDSDAFINLVADGLEHQVAERMGTLTASLAELGVGVSTGRVVDFRAANYLRAEPGQGTVPLIYPAHFRDGFVAWPKLDGRKPNALAAVPDTQTLLAPAGVYVLVKRFTSKEQKRRVTAAIYDPARLPAAVASSPVGFENHLNYFHSGGSGLPLDLARGLCAFLNSSLVDAFLRQFSGHTQVNATDLRSLKYPGRQALEALGRGIGQSFPCGSPNQDEVDRLIQSEILGMLNNGKQPDPVQAKKRVEEAKQVLGLLKLPKAQQNERSALALLALLDLTPEKKWSEASNPLRGITPMMDFFSEHYGKTYAPNTRETVRRGSVHQFVQAGLLEHNPDDPERPVNSANNVYRVTADALGLLRLFGSPEWAKSLDTYLASVAAIQARFAQQRAMQRIAVSTPSGEQISLSPGGQNTLIKLILEEFCPRYTPGGKVLYVGDADEKHAFYKPEYLAELGVSIEAHGKMPDVVVHHVAKNWLLLIEAVTSHGPVDVKRHIELKALFGQSSAGLVYVTTFLDRAAMRRYLSDIAWETEVWVADAPDHLIHFNGERFLGPY